MAPRPCAVLRLHSKRLRSKKEVRETPLYIRDEDALREALAALSHASVIGLDTEFMRDRTYFPRLCLVQMASEDHAYVIDAIELEGRLEMLERVLRAPHVVKVVHAGSQDIEALLRSAGTTVAPVFDTQIAATVAGFPTQVSYAQLVKDLLGVSVDKSGTFTDWAARPLTDAQIRYAESDVAHLPELYRVLHERLLREDRLGWLSEDFERMADPATYASSPREAFRRVKGASKLDRRGLGILRELAAWREQEAQRRDMPRRWLVSDESLVEIARRRPSTAKELAGIRGVNERTVRRHADAIIEAVKAGEAVAEEDLPRLPKRERPPADAQSTADLLSAVLRVRAREHGVAPSLIATRDDLVRFAAGQREGHPLSSGWRHAIAGAELEAVLDGAVALRIVDGKVSVVPSEKGVLEAGDEDVDA